MFRQSTSSIGAGQIIILGIKMNVLPGLAAFGRLSCGKVRVGILCTSPYGRETPGLRPKHTAIALHSCLARLERKKNT